MKKRKKDEKDELNREKKQKFNLNILVHSKFLPINVEEIYTNINTNSWFDIQKYKSLTKHKNIKTDTKIKLEKLEKCIKMKMILTKTQQNILQSWFIAHTNMYNEGIKFIKSNFDILKNDITFDILINELNKKKTNSFDNSYYLRSQLLNKKKIIQDNSQLKQIEKNTKIQTHTLDYALRQLCSNIKSAKTNLLRGKIKKFRIKYWSHNRPSKTIDIEKQYIKDNKICYKILGDIKYYYNGSIINLQNIDRSVKINYNKITDEYFLLIPEKIETKIIEKKTESIISLDPGLRTFMTGVSSMGMTKIGNNVNKIITKEINRINKIKNNPKISMRIKKKNEIMINRKISNKIDDLQWKSINYLVKNYKTIYLGNMSAKDIVRKESKILSNVQKVACLMTKYYQFNQRLEYKSKLYGVKLKVIDESYTSKTCSNCCYYDKQLGDSKIYNCYLCDMSIDRDLNGARNIFFKSIS
jgi:IS605 OrfB family transposase